MGVPAIARRSQQVSNYGLKPEPKRNVPYARVKTAESNSNAAKRGGKVEIIKNENKSKIVNDKEEHAANKNKIKPMIINKPSNQVKKTAFGGNQKVSASVMDIDVTKLESEEASIPKKAPKPTSQYSQANSRQVNRMGVRKHNSGEFNPPPIIPLHEIDDDFAPRNKKVGYQPPVKHGSKPAVKPKIETKSKDELSTIDMIKNIKKQRAQRDNKSQDISHKFVDQSSSITMNSGVSDEQIKTTTQAESALKSKDFEIEEEKIIDPNLSKEGSVTINLTQDDDEDDDTYDTQMVAYEFKDVNFDEDFTGHAESNLYVVKEDEELDDLELERRFILKSIHDAKEEIKTRREIFNKYTDEKTATTCFEYFKANFEDEDANHSNMEDIHMFFKRSGVKEFKEMVLECFRLSNAYKSLEQLENSLKELEEESLANN